MLKRIVRVSGKKGSKIVSVRVDGMINAVVNPLQSRGFDGIRIDFVRRNEIEPNMWNVARSSVFPAAHKGNED